MIDALPLLLADDGYQISRSVRLRSSASAYFSRTFPSAGSQTTWTFSAWVKRGALGTRQFITMSGTNPNTTQVWQVEFDANDKLSFYNQTIGTYRLSTRVFRDPSAWYHIVFCADTNNATAQNRFRCWINGVEITAWDTNSTISSGYAFAYNGAYAHGIGTYIYSPSSYLDGYLTEINFIDGQALTPSSFGQNDPITGVWKPKKYVGTYGTNGFYLNFSDNSNNTAATIGKDYSGNGNNWTPNNISVTAGVTYDSMLDVPTPWGDGGNGRGNYCTLNPLQKGSVITVSAANLQYASSSGNSYCPSTIGATTGKWYCEVFMTSAGTAAIVGIVNESASLAGYPGANTNGYGYYYDGQKYTNSVGSAYGSSYTTNDIIGIALDLDNGKVWFSKNGIWQASGDPVSGTNAAFTGISATNTWFFACGNSGVTTQNANFGQRPFAYTPPSGFRALNTQNLPTPTILKGNQFFDATTYTANGGAQTVTNSGGMQPDFLWIKPRSTIGSNILANAVVGVDKYLYSDQTAAEVTNANYITGVNSSGFSLGSANYPNGTTMVGWQWKEGATQGFDIVTFTGNGGSQTINHSLGVAPKMIIYKDRVAVSNWVVMHASLANMTAQYLLLNSTAAVANLASTVSAPTSTTFGSSASITSNGDATLAYLFAEVAGFSRFGSYTGNGSTDGAFIYTGFRPRYVMVKASSAVEGWVVWDSERNTFNTMPNVLYPNLSNAEGANTQIDFLSNGFKLRNSATNGNISGVTYIYAAFAENPFKYSLAR